MTVSNWTSGTSHTLPAGWPAIFDTLTGAGQTLDGGINFFWAHFWDGSTGVDPFIGVDISDANVWTKFYSENIGANGEGPMSVLNGYVSGDKPDYYFTGTAANWNSGIANKGNATVGGTMTVGAGTYA
jgi:hypothetical protein